MTPSVLLWRVAGTAVAVAGALALRWSTIAPWMTVTGASDVARVRLSWSARPERVEQCRTLSDEELSKLPEHMRMRTSCEGFTARYLLSVSVDGERLVLDTLRGGGLRHDRPIHVFTESDVKPGERRLRIEVTRIDEGESRAASDSTLEPMAVATDTLMGGRAQREREERSRREAEAIPARLVLDTLLSLAPRRVVLVTFNDDARRLVARMEH
ncbi:MAG TPA: hypothetical protein VIK50_06735 [Gemmatimonadaceae bacterium]